MPETTQRRKERIQTVLKNRQKDLSLIIDNIHDPHNVSAILRSCDAFGVYKVYLYYTSETFPELGRKSSASAMKWVEKEEHQNPESLFRTVKGDKFRTLAADIATGAKSLIKWDLTEPTAIILGNEHRGISPELIPYIDGHLYIPMQGMIESLNVSVAAAIILYEAWRQRQEAGTYQESSFSPETIQGLCRNWYKK